MIKKLSIIPVDGKNIKEFVMKLKTLLLVLSLPLLTQSAIADVSLQSFSFFAVNTTGGCSKLAGTWVGGGNVKSGFISCHYSGSGIIKMAKSNNFTMDVNLNRDSGWGCPDTEVFTLPGSCQNGSIILHTDNANLTGPISADGKSASLSGTVKLAGIPADVTDLNLHKQ
jgi:hypothetical protein